MRLLQLLFLVMIPGIFVQALEPTESLKGTVYSADTRLPLEGVEIEIINSGERVLTLEDGSFVIPVEVFPVLVTAAYPGFYTWESYVYAGSDVEIFLSLAGTRSGQTPVAGWWGETSRFKNAAFDYTNRHEFGNTAQLSADLAVQGRLQGLNVKAISGMPGEGGNFNIRGISSLFAHRNPLVVVDGVPVNTTMLESGIADGVFYNPLKSIDIKDIESIQVFRDGAALYGTRGGNGLILINTLRPVSAETKIDFSVQTGITDRPAYLPMMTATEHKTYLLNQFQTAGLPYDEMLRQHPWIAGNPSYFLHYNHDNNSVWQDEVFRMASVNKVNASLQGGDEIAKFAVLLGYLNQEGVVNNTGYQRFNFRFNSEVQILERLSMFSNVGFTYHTTDLQNAGIDYRLNPITASLLKAPMYAPYLRDQQGTQIALQSNADVFGLSNPLSIVDNAQSNSIQSQLFGNIRLDYSLSDKYHLSNIFNVSFDNIREKSFVPDYGIGEFEDGQILNFAREGIFKTSGFFNETTLNYNNQIDYTHFVNVNGGIRVSSYNEGYNKGSVFNTPTDEFTSLSSVTSIANTLIDGFGYRTNRSDLFLKSGYRFRDKYLVDVLLNLAASSNAGENASALNLLGGKWGFFPAINAAWLISSESFMSDVKMVDLLKLRASYSVSGNDFFLPSMNYGYESRPYGRNAGIVRTYMANPELKWEVVSQVNVGVDAGLFKERVMLSFDIYNRTTNNLLTYRQLPVVSGFDFFWENNGSLTSTGLDASLHARLLSRGFNLSVGGNFNTQSTQLNLPNDIVVDVPGGQVIMKDGGSGFEFFGYQTDGIFGSSEEAQSSGLVNDTGSSFSGGDVRFLDQDSNQIINESDRVGLGNLFPEFTGGFYLDMGYRNISLSILFDYSYGNSIFNYTRSLTESLSGYENQSITALYAWKGENDITDVPRMVYGDPAGNARFSDRWIEDGSFLRLKEVTLSYKFPGARFYNDLTIYVTGQNLLTFSNYLGYYPEFAYSNSPALQGIDYGQTPLTPLFVAGIKLGL
jgi:TonB-linked SusC/RagA family outer membrane protein